MEPIVNPWLVYLVGQIDAWKVLGGMGGVMTFVLGALVYIEKPEGFFDRKAAKCLCLLGAIVLLISIALPSSTTLVGMYAAKQITPATVRQAIADGRDLKNELKGDILVVIQAMTKEESKIK